MNLKQLSRKVKVESSRIKRQLGTAPTKLKKQLDAEVKRLEAVPDQLKKQFDTAPTKLRKQLDAEVKRLEAVPAQLKKQLDITPTKLRKQLDAEVKRLEAVPVQLRRRLNARTKKLTPSKLVKHLEELPGRMADAVGIVRASQLKAVRAELNRLSKRIDALSRAEPAKQDAA